MPIYEYQCEDCGEHTEVLQRMSDPPLAECPECEGKVRKLISAPAFQFKGSGWYVTDYARNSDAKKTEGSGEESGDAKETKKEAGKAAKGDAAKESKADSSTSSKVAADAS